MSDMKALANLMRELEDQLVVCMRCGMCQAVCPVFAETGRESDVARGKLALLDGLMQEMFKQPEGVNERLNKCLLCGSCSANCPSGVNVLEIFIKARAILTDYTGLSPAKKIILRGMLARPELFDRLTEWGAKFQKYFTKPANEIVGTSCARISPPFIGDRHFRTLAENPFHKVLPSLDTKPGKSGLRVAFYVGCLLDKIFPHVAQAVVDVLNHHEVGIFMPSDQGCCGIPAIASGDTKTFYELIRHNMEKFEAQKFDYLITSCATCTSTIKKIWPMMTRHESGDIRDKAEALAKKTLDITQFLVSEVGVRTENADSGETRDGIRITYHDPCHLKKSLGISSEPRTLLQSNSDYCFEEMPEADRCCGLGGSFNLHYYDISTDIGKRKRDNILSADCSAVAAGCPACMIQLSDVLSKGGDQISVRHPVEIYAEKVRKQ
ncbi:MAG: (Fe-S)-binding protein [Desulfobacteraceae bacterium 4572_88]|nr:MAG: (Fe-S)-binding protein [Desulfobacteraceae bacterium 4572_88]